MGATLSNQQQFFENVFIEMEAESGFRAAIVFQHIDWDPDIKKA